MAATGKIAWNDVLVGTLQSESDAIGTNGFVLIAADFAGTTCQTPRPPAGARTTGAACARGSLHEVSERDT